jgi:hypothetical protein
MQRIISNSSPIIHLAKIDQLDLLKEYFGTLTVPESVYNECVADGKERPGALLIKNAEWIEVVQAQDKKLIKLLQSSLDNGESEAISLAIETGADLILLDDSDAREKARLYNLNITGTVGILLRAKEDGKIHSFRELLKKLKETGFWVSNDLETRLITEAGETV